MQRILPFYLDKITHQQPLSTSYRINQLNFPMKVAFALFAWLMVMATSFSQNTPADPAASWLTNMEEARAQSAETGHPILMVFAGSDWCKPCILLRRELFDAQIFTDYAAAHLVLLELDFPSMKKNKLSDEQTKHNESMAEKFNPEGEFPLALLMDAEEHVLGHFGYDHSLQPADYITHIQSLIPHANP